MKPFLTLTLFASLAGVGSSATIVQSHDYSFVPTNSQSLTYDKFDTSLGTLTSVTITTSLTKSGGSLFLDNDSGSPASGTVSQTVRIDLTTTSGVSFVSASGGTIGSDVTANSAFAVDLAADNGGDGPGYQDDGGTDNGGQAFADVSTSQTSTVHSFFQNTYEGTGTFDIAVGGIQSFNTSTVSGAAGSFTNSTAAGSVVITYNYTPPAPVPEPTTTLLGGLGVLALVRRRRR